jgi:AraC-like DNA-binding protein
MFISNSAIDELHVRLFEACYVERSAFSWNAQNVQDRHWRLYYNSKGKSSLEMATGSFALRPGNIYLIPARVIFSCLNPTRIHHFYAHFDVFGVPQRALQTLFAAPLCLSPALELENQCAALARELAAGQPLDEARRCKVKALIYQGLAKYLEMVEPKILEQYRHLGVAHAPVLPALEFIEENLSQPHSNAALAALCGYSEDHFIRSFFQCVGNTPARYVQELRVTAAAQQLLFSNDSIEAISEAAGFTNRFYFSRVFKEHTGFSPAAYRKNSRV